MIFNPLFISRKNIYILTAILVCGRILKIKDAKSFFFGFSSLIRTMEVEIVRTKITLACTECKQRNYNTTKDKKNHPDRMEIKKYCKFCRTHTVHKETK